VDAEETPVAPEPGRAREPRRTVAIPVVLHALAFGAAVAVAILDGLSPFGGSSLAASLGVPLVALAIGTIRLARGGPGARPILVGADLLVLLAAAFALILSNGFEPTDPVRVVVLLGLAAAALASLVVPGRARPAPSGLVDVVRKPRDRWLAVAMLVLAVVASAVPWITFGSQSPSSAYGEIARSIATGIGGSALAVVAWWWGARWLLAFDAVVTLGTVIVTASTTGGSTLDWALDNNTLLAILELVAVAVGPRRSAAIDREPPPTRGSVAGRVWLVLGGIAYVPLLLYTLYPPVSDLCLRCDVGTPGHLLAAFDAVGFMAVPAGVLAILGIRSRPGPGVAAAWVLIAMSGALLVQVALALVGWGVIWPTSPMALAATLVFAGAIDRLAASRGRWLVGAGWVAGLAAIAVASVWLLRVSDVELSAVRPYAIPLLIGVPILLLGIAREAAVAVEADRAGQSLSGSRPPEDR
jgi:hypothetical protein